VEYWERRDPLERFQRHLISRGVAAAGRLDEIVADVRREIEEDSAWAESSPMPEAEKAAYNVFDNSIVPPAFRPKLFGGNS
jgi:TPP-dependent pyruvate/acetoin dehydrogenase alpha subunit